MKLITRDSDYAIRALCFIAKHKERIVSVSELVEELIIPRPFLRKILQVLHSKGILRSYKGKGGGFLLAKLPNNILLIDIMGIFQGRLRLNECIFKGLKCPNTKACILNKKIANIEKFVLRELSDISIGCLIKKR